MILELVAFGVIGIAVIGPKKLPKASRLAGRFAGKALKTVIQLRESLQQSSDSEIIQLKQDLEKGLGELSSIKGEIRRSINLKNTVFISNPMQSQFSAPQQTPSNPQPISAPISNTEPIKQIYQPTFSSASNPFAMIGQQQQQFSSPQQTFDMEKAKQISQQVTKPNPYELDPSFTPKTPSQYSTSPFSKIYYGPPSMEELYDDTSLLAKTERVNSGADLVSKAVLEQYYARNADKQQ